MSETNTSSGAPVLRGSPRPEGQSFAGEPEADLLAAIDVFAADPPNFAKASERGKFPMAAMKKSADGMSLDMVPLTHACTAESFDKIRALVAALSAWRAAIARAEPSPPIQNTAPSAPGMSLESEGGSQ